MGLEAELSGVFGALTVALRCDGSVVGVFFGDTEGGAAGAGGTEGGTAGAGGAAGAGEAADGAIAETEDGAAGRAGGAGGFEDETTVAAGR